MRRFFRSRKSEAPSVESEGRRAFDHSAISSPSAAQPFGAGINRHGGVRRAEQEKPLPDLPSDGSSDDAAVITPAGVSRPAALVAAPPRLSTSDGGARLPVRKSSSTADFGGAFSSSSSSRTRTLQHAASWTAESSSGPRSREHRIPRKPVPVRSMAPAAAPAPGPGPGRRPEVAYMSGGLPSHPTATADTFGPLTRSGPAISHTPHTTNDFFRPAAPHAAAHPSHPASSADVPPLNNNNNKKKKKAIPSSSSIGSFFSRKSRDKAPKAKPTDQDKEKDKDKAKEDKKDTQASTKGKQKAKLVISGPTHVVHTGGFGPHFESVMASRSGPGPDPGARLVPEGERGSRPLARIDEDGVSLAGLDEDRRSLERPVEHRRSRERHAGNVVAGGEGWI